MSIADEEILRLEQRLDSLVRTQIDFQKEITAIRAELTRLRAANRPRAEAPRATEPPRPEPNYQRPPPRSQPPPYREPEPAPSFGYGSNKAESEPDPVTAFFDRYTESARADFEKFIGENLISKIGIVVLVLGVGIGAKYAIDNDLISPLTRIIIGYVFGFGLVGLAIKWKPKYHNFSAVLISGGMAIMYFVTFFAYSTYGLISQLSAFALMVMFTAFTVVAALVFSRQVIAHIGLVGAYAVPFLLSSDSGNYLALFVYMAIINAGILAISIRKYWIPIFYTAFAFTWAIFYGWFITKFAQAEHFYLALIFVTVFFSIFLATRIAQKVYHDEINEHENLISALVNGAVFFLFCLALSSGIREIDRLWIFFSFLAAAAVAILLISFKFYRQWFVYLCFPAVWLIYGAWFIDRYDPAEHFVPASVFAGVFFAVFYLTVLVHRLIAESFSFVEHTTAVLSNSFIFYGFGYSIIDSNPALQNFLGLYTAANSALHLTVAHVVSRLRESAVDVVQVLTILVLTFASIAVPVQFDGNFVTLIWSVEAALLFWYGRTQAVRLFEYFSYPVMVLAIGSMFLDWATAYGTRTPIVNGDLVTAAVFVIAFSFIFYVNRDEQFQPVIDAALRTPVGWAIASLAVFVLYNALRIEIGNWHNIQIGNLNAAGSDYQAISDLRNLNLAWQMNYTMLFLAMLGAVNIVKARSRVLGVVSGVLSLIALFVFCTVGMILFIDLRENYMAGNDAGVINIAIRYIGYACAALLLLMLYRYSRDEELSEGLPKQARLIAFESVAYGTAFIAASCELVNVMGQMRIPDATKLGLSILWGIYALLLVVIGIAKNRKHLRIAAFALLGVTLAKLFLYDIADLGTIPKTILFVTLGITMLAVSFLYNKYKDLIFGAEAKPEEN